MCGISGIVSSDGQPIAREKIEKMVQLIRHRGPDDEGYYIKGNVGLGHCRLSIIDLSQAGHQPMTNENKSLWVVHNGEIYNYLELREELKSKGHIFKSDTDTEVILHSYEEWGEDCLRKFNGMWAFAIWDENRKELFCSRDRFGIKPFYYFSNEKKFAFASEIKSLLELNTPNEPNDILIYDFLQFGLLDHTNETFFKNIAKLPAASWLKIKEDGQMTIGKYWDFEVSDERKSSKSEDKKNSEEFLESFIDSVKLRLRSDVPVGTCLSGGLDSSSVFTVVNTLLKQSKFPCIGEKQKTFSSCSDDKLFDEREYIEEAIKGSGAESHYIFPKPQNFLDEIDDLLWHQEEPFAGTAVYAQWSVIKEAKRKTVKVLLDGQGGDELLGGYFKFYVFYLLDLLRNKKIIKFTTESFRLLTSYDFLRSINVRIRNGLIYFKIGRKMLNADGLLGSSFKKKFTDRTLSFGSQKTLGQRFKSDATRFSLPVLLRYADKNTSAFAVEGRLPFLDYRLVEKIAALPYDQKLRNSWTKYILRESLKGILPEKIRLRKTKLGFSTPEKSWIKEVMSEDMKSVFGKAYFLKSYVDTRKLMEMFDNFLNERDHRPSGVFFRFYILELWGRKFILNEPVA